MLLDFSPDTKKRSNTYSYDYIMSRNLSYGGTDDEGYMYWVDDNGNRYYVADTDDTGSGNTGQVTDTGAATNIWDGSQDYGNNPQGNGGGNNDPFKDIPPTAAPGKFSKQSVKQTVLGNHLVQQAKSDNMRVVLTRKNLVDGVPITETTVLNNGAPGAPVYNVSFSGPLKSDGSLISDQQVQFVYPGLSAGDTPDVVRKGGGGSGGTGGPSGGSPGGSSGNISKDTSVTDKNDTTDTSDKTNNNGVTVNGYAQDMGVYYGRTNNPLTPAKKKFDEDYKKKEAEKLKRQAPKDAKVTMRFRHYDDTFDADGNENYSEDEIVIHDGKPGGGNSIYDVDIHGLTENGGLASGGDIWGHWETNPRDEITPIEPSPMHLANLSPLPELVTLKPVPNLPPFVSNPPPATVPLNFQLATDILLPLPNQPLGLNQSLQNLANWLNDNPDKIVIIEGNTPLRVRLNQLMPVQSLYGRPQINRVTVRAFLRARATAVRNLLIRRYNVNRSQLNISAGGNTGLNGVTNPSASFVYPIDPVPVLPLRSLPVNIPAFVPVPIVPIPDLPPIQF